MADRICVADPGEGFAGIRTLFAYVNADGLNPQNACGPAGVATLLTHCELLPPTVDSLRRIEELAPRVAYAGHKEPVRNPASRAREIRAHHDARLDRAEAALDGDPRSAYEVSLALFEEELSATLRRFATAESLAHLERLVAEGRAARDEPERYVRV